MEDTKALTTEIKAGSISIRNVDEALRLGEIFWKSGFFTDVKSASQAIVKMLAGAELGFGPIASMSGVYVQNGRTAFMANLIASAIKRNGYDYKVETLTNERCVLVFIGKDGKEIGESVFTMDDAKVAGLNTGKNAHSWQHFPRNMLFARALTNGARWFTPEIFGGVSPYTPDELDMVVDGETGEVISEAESSSPPPNKSEPERVLVPTVEGGLEEVHPRTVEFQDKHIPAEAMVSQPMVARFNTQFVGPSSQKGSIEDEGKFHPAHLTRHLKTHFNKAKLPDLTNEEFVALVKYVWLTLGRENGGLTAPWYSDKIQEAVGDLPENVSVVGAEPIPYDNGTGEPQTAQEVAVTLKELYDTWLAVFPGNNPNIERVISLKYNTAVGDLTPEQMSELAQLVKAVTEELVTIENEHDAVRELSL